MVQVRKSRAAWVRVVSEYERVGGDQRAFADARDVNLESFRSWLYRLRREGLAGTPRLLPVEVTSGLAPFSAVEVAVAGLVLRIPADAPPELAARWVVCMERRSC